MSHIQKKSRQTQDTPQTVSYKVILKKALTTDESQLFKFSFIKQLRWLIQLSQKTD